MRAVVRSVDAVLEAALLLAVLFLASLVWVWLQIWSAFLAGLEGTPWAQSWRVEDARAGGRGEEDDGDDNR